MAIDPTITVYVTLDLLAWQQQGTLVLSPKFQRRSVWSPAAKSSFVDTVLRGFPVPPLHLRIVKDANRGIVREVIDGQQRLRALLGYIAGEFKLSTQLDGPWAGKTFAQLEEHDRDQIEGYRFQIYQYSEIADELVLEIFSRINTYSISLNTQELRYGKYFGEFKQSVYALAFSHLDFWRESRLFTDQAIARMQEAQLVSELLVLQMDGMQDKKTVLDDYYRALDESWGAKPHFWGKRQTPRNWLSRSESEHRFTRVVEDIRDSLGGEISNTAFKRVPLFYTLYAVVYHYRYGLPGFDVDTPMSQFNSDARSSLRLAVHELTAVLDAKAPLEELNEWQREFVAATARQTDNIEPRRRRFETLWARAKLGA